MTETKKVKLKKDSCKKFLLGIMDIIILHLVRKKPMSGYDIINHVKDTFAVKISSGTIYPIISKLRKQRLISVKKYDRKTLFCSTKKGDIIRRMLLSHYLDIKKNIEHMFEEKKK